MILIIINSYIPLVQASNQELDICSHKLEISRDRRRATFTGDVQVRFQDMLVKAGKIEILYAEKIVKNNRPNIDKLVISQDFVALKGDDVIKGHKAEYYIANEELRIFDAILVINNIITKASQLSYQQKLRKIILGS